MHIVSEPKIPSNGFSLYLYVDVSRLCLPLIELYMWYLSIICIIVLCLLLRSQLKSPMTTIWCCFPAYVLMNSSRSSIYIYQILILRSWVLSLLSILFVVCILCEFLCLCMGSTVWLSLCVLSLLDLPWLSITIVLDVFHLLCYLLCGLWCCLLLLILFLLVAMFLCPLFWAMIFVSFCFSTNLLFVCVVVLVLSYSCKSYHVVVVILNYLIFN